jgi:hypothetical protein
METLFANAIQNSNNENIMSLSYAIINKRKHKILLELKLLSMENKLTEYRHVDELHELRMGCFIRWFNLSTELFANGGFIVRIDIEANGPLITCKNQFNKFFMIKLNECIIFQKITQQEHVLLSAMEHLA